MAPRRAHRGAAPRTRPKPAISYVETTTTDDDNESGDDSDSSVVESPRRTSPRSKRTSPLKRSARQTLDDEDEDDDTSEDDLQRRPVLKRQKTSRNGPSRAARSAKKAKPSRNQMRHSLRVTKPALRSKSRESSVPAQVFFSGVIPPWQTLPYQILLQIFEFASFPLYDEHTFAPTASPKWLLDMSRLCRAFAEPALTALYCSPPLVPMVYAHRLVDLVNEDSATKAFRYRRKIRSLCIDVHQVLAYSLPGSGHLDLYDLVKDLPLLENLELYHQKDMPPYRQLDETVKWTYPENIFDALEHIDPTHTAVGDKADVCKLKSWRWSSRLAGKTWSVLRMKEVHLKPSFSALRKIAFVNYQIPKVKKDEEQPEHEKILADSLKPLKNLEHLVFESSALVNATLLPLLPKNLRRLELINCWDIIAEDFAEFLLTHGSQLRELTLNHNQSLSLSFLTVLGTACPDLEVFKMNLTYFNQHFTYHDSEPAYEKLLCPEQLPVWPSTLRTIELIQLRKWDTEAAEMFFQSLLDSAATLPDLRRLTIQAILNIGWRDRASFRDKWVGSLNKVFKQVLVPPRAHATLRIPEPTPDLKRCDSRPQLVIPTVESKLLSKALSSASSASSSESSSFSSVEPPTRRSQRSSARQPRPNVYVESPDTSEAENSDDMPLIRRRAEDSDDEPLIRSQSTRLTGLARELNILKQTAGMDSPPDVPSSPANAIVISDDSDDEPLVKRFAGKAKAKAEAKPAQVIQGKCEVVEVRIDNLRPTERQVTEADFLDEEASGDDDWNGEDPDEEAYAW
ncbi:hypothetical protein HYFRA_00000872 [Hymenoscyphus fraxineus]|uniref:Uncharacterized protein n=1 Tax=Hymenoscyphus fraxineus TaxID=746836 RepID=A0A9N9KRF3_9HELO|nr:hypothetical protein HYFRA_00000872 [Hymenoscyphus fraxineus]